MKTAKITDNSVLLILGLMGKVNALAMRICLTTGIRISDALQITREQAEKGRFTIHESKTGKSKRIRLSKDIQRECLAIAGQYYVFEARDHKDQHRTRQAVSKDLQSVILRLEKAGYTPHLTSKKGDPDKITIGTHSMRKTYVRKLEESGADVKVIQGLLNHDNDLTTLVYILAAEVDFRKSMRRKKPAIAAGPFGCGVEGKNLLEAAPEDIKKLIC